LDYASIGRSMRRCTIQAAEYTSQDDAAALDAVVRLARTEGILPAIESAHAVAEALKVAPTMAAHDILVVNLSGRGDKDMGYWRGNSSSELGRERTKQPQVLRLRLAQSTRQTPLRMTAFCGAGVEVVSLA